MSMPGFPPIQDSYLSMLDSARSSNYEPPLEHSEDSIEQFFKHSLEEVEGMDFTDTNSLVELTSIILKSKKFYEAQQQFTEKLIGSLLEKIAEKILDFRAVFCEMQIDNLKYKITEARSKVEFYRKLISENLAFVAQMDPHRHETFNAIAQEGFMLTDSCISNNIANFNVKIYQVNTIGTSTGFLDLFDLILRQSKSNISEERAREVMGFVRDYQVRNLKNFSVILE
ncbi:MAG: hypothetical protein K1060chlam4_00843 [Candidatus Anoxychlamydiales bacterium]|nr:hypothetical protein [Candidatus Anoxychlamydiales bacterium]